MSPASGAGYLCEVNLTTGAATYLFALPGSAEVVGMYVKAAGPSGSVPAQATNLAADFPNGQLSGTVSFDIPTTLSDGTSASGQVSYAVTANGLSIATGNAPYGQRVVIPVTLQTTGQTEFAVTLSNDDGSSEATTTSCFVGMGVPKEPADIVATWSDGKVKITWSPVAESADGGYIDPAQVRYTVKSGQTVLKADLADTHYEYDLEKPEAFTRLKYTVSASYHESVSMDAPSNSLFLGIAEPPYDACIATEDDLGAFTRIDSNEDGNKWEYYRESAYVISNNRLPADDWLISMPVRMEAGYLYEISTQVYGTMFTDERFELKVGTAPTAEGMTTTLIEPTNLQKVGQAQTYSASFTPSASGVYYVGLHAISEPLQFALYTKGIKVSEPIALAKPAAGLLKAVPDPNGDYKITVHMTAPSLDLGNEPLSALIKSELYRDGTLIQTYQNPTPGSSWEYVDVVEAGSHTYKFVSYTSGGEGPEVSVAGFSGTDGPAPVAEIRVAENTANGFVTLSWPGVTTDQNGNPLNPAKVKYSVYSVLESGKVEKTHAEDISETTLSFKEYEPGADQRFVKYAVTATTEGGSSVASAVLTPVGKADKGLEDSFADAASTYLFGINSYGTDGKWILADDSAFLHEKSYDDDNGFLYFMAGYTGDKADFFTGKVDLAGMKNPTVKFYTYPFEADNNILEVRVREIGGDYTTLLRKSMSELGDGSGWVPVQVPLSEYKDKVVQVAIFVEAVSSQFSFVDKLAIEPLVEHDLRIKSISAPKEAKAGYEFNIDVKVENKGTLPSEAYTVELYADGALVGSQRNVAPIEFEKSAVVSLSHIMDRFADNVIYSAKVMSDNDEVAHNNVSEEISVARISPEYPSVMNLTGTYTQQGNVLTWSQPNLDMPERPVKETFEDGDSWAQTYGDWIFVDVDKAAAGGISGMTIPGIRPGKDTSSFFVFDYLDGDWGETFTPVSGRKCLTSLYCLDNPAIDDWAISPELTGDAQTLKFFAKSYRDVYPETLEVYYSTGSTNPADFVLIENTRVEKVPADWTQYSIELPAGANRFAIRSCGFNSMLLMLDDFEFIAAPVSKGLEIQGYDVYRDKVRLTDTPCEATTWTDANRQDNGAHTYTVIPVYNRGEGIAARVEVSKYGSVDQVESAVEIRTAPGMIIVMGATGQTITVADTAGRVVTATTGSSETRIPVSVGIYLVKAGNTATKVMVP